MYTRKLCGRACTILRVMLLLEPLMGVWSALTRALGQWCRRVSSTISSIVLPMSVLCVLYPDKVTYDFSYTPRLRTDFLTLYHCPLFLDASSILEQSALLVSWVHVCVCVCVCIESIWVNTWAERTSSFLSPAWYAVRFVLGQDLWLLFVHDKWFCLNSNGFSLHIQGDDLPVCSFLESVNYVRRRSVTVSRVHWKCPLWLCGLIAAWSPWKNCTACTLSYTYCGDETDCVCKLLANSLTHVQWQTGTIQNLV